MVRSAATAVDFLPFSKLTKVNLAPRVRSLLEASYQATWPKLEDAVTEALDDLDQEIFKQAEKSASVNDQNRNYEAMREFRRLRADFVMVLRDLLQRGIVALVDPSIANEALPAVPLRSPRAAELSLVEPTELEQELVLTEIAARADIRANTQLLGLAYRFGVIAGTPPLEIENLPLGPHQLCAAMRLAAKRFDVAVAFRLRLFRHLDRRFFATPVPFYEALNRSLIEHRVFPNLQFAARKPAVVQSASSSASESHQADASAASVATSSAREVQSQAQAQAHPPNAAPNVPKEFRDSPAAQAFSQLVNSPAADSPRAASAAPADTDSAMDAQFFTTLRELLSGRRGGSDAVDSSRPVADTQDVQSILTVLQSQPVAPVMVGGKWMSPGVGHIKQDMMNQLRALSDGVPQRLREEDADTIDLVGFLFDHLLSDYPPNSLSHGLVSRLQVPLLKVALKDKSFFTRRNHPARQLLNTIAETSSYWVEDEEQDRPVIEKMRVVVDRVINEFDDDVNVFDDLFDDLNKHMGGLQKKAEVAERRHVEAARGREKLDLARSAAQEAVEQRIFEYDPPIAVRSLLESTWSDAISLSMLRQGIDSKITRERLVVVEQLCQLFEPGRTLAQRQQVLEDLRGPLEDGLGAVGFHEDAISKVCDDISRLLESTGDDDSPPVSSPGIEQLVKQNPRLGGDSRPVAAMQSIDEGTPIEARPASSILQNLRKVEPVPLGPKERDMVDRVKQLPFGTWFDFTVNQQGERQRRKLCWFSPVTGRCLFVNPRGGKAEERMIDQLARDLLRGNANVVDEANEKLIDRAWKGIVSMLKGVGIGQKEVAQVPA